MRLTNPLQRRTTVLAQADDRIYIWLIVQGWLLGWGLGLVIEPYLPTLFTRPFTVAALWPFNLLPHQALGALMLAGGLAVAVSCWLALGDTLRFALRMIATALLLVLFWSYVYGGFPYAGIQFGVFIVVLAMSYLFQPREC
jgi:hypothetical protein